MKKKELIDYHNFYLKMRATASDSSPEYMVDLYLKSINSTRRSERRADGSNSKAKEVCVHPYKYVRFDLGRKKHYCHKCRCYLKQTD